MIHSILCAPLYAKSTGFITDGAVAIRQNYIVAVGHRDQILPLASASTHIQSYPLEALLIPSFCDSHQHILSYIRGRVERLSLWDAITLDHVFARIKAKAATLPAGTWIVADGHDQGRYTEQRHPTLAELDAIAPHHPLIIHRACHHVAIANSAALNIAHVTDTTQHNTTPRWWPYRQGQPWHAKWHTRRISAFISNKTYYSPTN